MATWDDYYWYGGPIRLNGLRICPFDPNHKVKPDKYLRHVKKCEQKFPNAKNISQGSGLNSVQCSSIDSVLDTNSMTNGSDINSLTNYMKRMTTSDNWSNNDGVHSSSADFSAIGAINSETIDITDSAIGSTQGLVLGLNGQPINGNPDLNEVTASPSNSSTITITPHQTTAFPDSSTDVNGSGDVSDEWNNSSEPSFSLYSGYENFDDLTDEQIMDMADSFVDTVMLSKMTKKQRKRLNERLVSLRQAEKERKTKVFSQLVSFKEVWDPQLKDIPQEIRKPKVDIREIFNFKKEQNNRIDTIQSKTEINREPTVSPTKALSPESLLPVMPVNASPVCVRPMVGNSPKTVESEQPTQQSGGHLLNSSCNNCWQSINVTEENIRRLTIFCAECSGIKFGGFFECQSCQMYGYFANNQISQHLSKHFSEN